MMTHPLCRRIADVLDLDVHVPAIQYDGQWFSWGELGRDARHISALVAEHGGGAPRVGIMLRNRPAHVAALLGVLLAGGTVVVINPSRGDVRTRSDISALQLRVVVGESTDLKRLLAPSPLTTVITLGDLTGGADVIPAIDAGEADPGRPGVAVWMLTSGTTGPLRRNSSGTLTP